MQELVSVLSERRGGATFAHKRPLRSGCSQVAVRRERAFRYRRREMVVNTLAVLRVRTIEMVLGLCFQI